jgi:hypothetical protein
MITVKATREGLLGGKTASGYLVDRVVPFVALPSTKALHRFVRITNPANGKTCLAICLDVGPWNEHDDTYVFQPATAPGSAASGICPPQAESGVDRFGRTTNHAGIDLGERVWHALGMTDNDLVAWEFLP